MNDLANSTTSLVERIVALYEAMFTAGDETLTFEVTDHIESLANYTTFVAKQEILMQKARHVMDDASFRIFFKSAEHARKYAFEKVVFDVNALNRLCRKYNVTPIAENVLQSVKEEEDNGNLFASISSTSFAVFAKEIVDAYYTADVAGTATK